MDQQDEDLKKAGLPEFFNTHEHKTVGQNRVSAGGGVEGVPM